ncbi:MAG: UDP-N-acetylmuramoyl-tripeptide--D-alanyl-D-alanine ligase, partial [Verrucomicrobia bacterium]
AVFRGVSTDSRAAAPGTLFVALSGERFDGHDYLAEVAARGVAGAMVGAGKASLVPAGLCALAVDSPRAAYGRLAARYRGEFGIPVACVAGSNGKTTTKELLAALLSTAGETLRSESSFNNDVGVPHTLLRLEAAHRFAVLEAGTNHPGELAPLVAMIRPTRGILTQIGGEHLEFFGDLEGVAREEGALADGLPADGLLVLPAATPHADAIAARTRARVVRVDWEGGAGDWSAAVTACDWKGQRFAVRSPRPDWTGEWELSLSGRHNVLNALAAMVVAAESGVEPGAARRALAAFRPPRQRLAMAETGGVRLLDDTYNANADSMGAALRTLSDLPCAGRRVAVLGDMAELGAMAETAHREVGCAAATAVDALFAVGRFAGVTAGAARGAGLQAVVTCADAEAATAALAGFVRRGDTVLLKASRSARLERVADALRELLGKPGPN